MASFRVFDLGVCYQSVMLMIRNKEFWQRLVPKIGKRIHFFHALIADFLKFVQLIKIFVF